MDLHDVTEIVTKLSRNKVLTMNDYDAIVEFMKRQDQEDELDTIRRLGGI